MSEYTSTMQLVMDELEGALESVDPGEVCALVDELTSARRVFVVGVGRVLLSLQAFVKRLNHLGIPAYYVGQIDEPAISPKDVLVVASGSGESAIPVAIARIAKAKGARLAHIGSNTASTVSSMVDLVVRIPCCTKLNLPDEIPSGQPMSSLFEQSLYLLCDIVCLCVIRRKDIDIKTLWDMHANLE